MECNNCGNDIDFDWIVSSKVQEMLENFDNKEDLKEFLDNKFDFSINQACDSCYNTLWVEGKDRELFYEVLEAL